MAEENKDMDVDDQEMMEEGDEDWEYYDDNDVLTDFWQVSIIKFTRFNPLCSVFQDFITNDIDFSKPLSNWTRSFTKPMGMFV